MTEEFTDSRDTFPFHADCYSWPQVAVASEDTEPVILNVHCLRDMNRKEFCLVGFIGMDREEQISNVIFLAKEIGAQVIAFKGVGFDDRTIGGLMSRMEEPLPRESPGQKVGLLRPDWPTRFQRRLLWEAMDMGRHGAFHETSLAHRMHASVDEVRRHLDLLSDLGLMECPEDDQ
ncbi:hypothetical protein MINTM020_44750 [Mycobacterium paraintracellulare]|uniref:hypothetical protein n=1 Tax=Mycobacterium paraintracellulare TaxID=1138383 RepID=UPI00192700C1|nr:hypothetical protein [Mycobacterium paraintracellulare]BCP12377.1 hypothetical protein MINTM020_44750 [Mycobacterium paraintracellulare]